MLDRSLESLRLSPNNNEASNREVRINDYALDAEEREDFGSHGISILMRFRQKPWPGVNFHY